MKTLYKIDHEIVLNPHEESEVASIMESSLGEQEIDRVLSYIEAAKDTFDSKYTDHKFIILSPIDKIELTSPKLLATKHHQKHKAHKLSDFFNPDNEEI